MEFCTLSYRNLCLSQCNCSWIWNPLHTPKLGSFRAMVEMDKLYFTALPKLNRGHVVEESWKDVENLKWAFVQLKEIAIQSSLNKL